MKINWHEYNDKEHGVIQFAKNKKVVQDVADLYQRKINGEEVSKKEWKDACAAAAARADAAAAAYADDAAYTLQEKIKWSDEHKELMKIAETPEYQALKALVEDKPDDEGCNCEMPRLVSEDNHLCLRCRKDMIVEEPKKPEKQTLRQIAENKYSSFKHGHREPTTHQWFLCLSEYLEQGK